MSEKEVECTISIDDWTAVRVSTFTTEKQRRYVSVTAMKKDKGKTKAFPQKTKKGGFNLCFLTPDTWAMALPKLIEVLNSLGVSIPQDVPTCCGCGQEITEDLLCQNCKTLQSQGDTEPF